MAGRRQDEGDEMGVEALEELVLRHEREQPSEEERRAFRRLHTDLREELIANRDDITGDGLQSALDRIEQNFGRVHTTREAVKDAENIRLLAEMQRQRMQGYDINLVRFLPGEFAENLKKYSVDMLRAQHDRGPLCTKAWNLLGQHCQQYYRKSPALHFMCGSFERGEVVKKVVARDRRPKDTEPGKTTELKQLESFKETSKNEATTKEVESVLQTLWYHYELNGKGPICYFEFVMNPTSFGQSVENIFYVSFLARDGYVQLDLDEDGLPVLEPLEGSMEDKKSEGKARQQIVISITPAEWKEIVQTFKITEPLIKSRVSRTKSLENGAGPSTG
ncbi:EP300-interacting inhibitor of differentiation 3-like [Babylonia areolata]|uniref:EP300-interacting inhibitor of differentiation 3-like n=1 Tax=Babylonia areolata TaxID=304850 RepID=UPI003FD29BFD